MKNKDKCEMYQQSLFHLVVVVVVVDKYEQINTAKDERHFD